MCLKIVLFMGLLWAQDTVPPISSGEEVPTNQEEKNESNTQKSADGASQEDALPDDKSKTPQDPQKNKAKQTKAIKGLKKNIKSSYSSDPAEVARGLGHVFGVSHQETIDIAGRGKVEIDAEGWGHRNGSDHLRDNIVDLYNDPEFPDKKMASQLIDDLELRSQRGTTPDNYMDRYKKGKVVNMNAGWMTSNMEGHATTISLYKNKIAITNTGDGALSGGTTIYELNTEDPEFEKKLKGFVTKVQDATKPGHTKADYNTLVTKEIKSVADTRKPLFLPQKNQKVGNCTYQNARKALAFNMAVRDADPKRTNKKIELTAENLEKGKSNSHEVTQRIRDHESNRSLKVMQNPEGDVDMRSLHASFLQQRINSQAKNPSSSGEERQRIVSMVENLPPELKSKFSSDSNYRKIQKMDQTTPSKNIDGIGSRINAGVNRTVSSLGLWVGLTNTIMAAELCKQRNRKLQKMQSKSEDCNQILKDGLIQWSIAFVPHVASIIALNVPWLRENFLKHLATPVGRFIFASLGLAIDVTNGALSYFRMHNGKKKMKVIDELIESTRPSTLNFRNFLELRLRSLEAYAKIMPPASFNVCGKKSFKIDPRCSCQKKKNCFQVDIKKLPKKLQKNKKIKEFFAISNSLLQGEKSLKDLSLNRIQNIHDHIKKMAMPYAQKIETRLKRKKRLPNNFNREIYLNKILRKAKGNSLSSLIPPQKVINIKSSKAPPLRAPKSIIPSLPSAPVREPVNISKISEKVFKIKSIHGKSSQGIWEILSSRYKKKYQELMY